MQQLTDLLAILITTTCIIDTIERRVFGLGVHSFVSTRSLSFTFVSTLTNAMPHLVSASVDDTVFCSRANSNAKFTYSVSPHRLSHATSAIELRGPQSPAYATSFIRRRKGLHQRRRAASSFPLNEIRNHNQRSVSKSGSSYGKDSLLSLPSSKLDENSTSISGSLAESAYPSPPLSEDGKSPTPLVSEEDSVQAVDSFPFPLNPVPLPPLKFPTEAHLEGPHSPTRRTKGAETQPRTPTRSPDRYISNRHTPQEPSETFRVSKSPHQLSVPERLLRRNTASPDPFGPLVLPRLREVKSNTNDGPQSPVNPGPRRPIGTTNVTALPDPFAARTRHASAGAVWNIGGGAHHTGPIRSVSNGRGGFVSGGSNAPMYSSQFFDDGNSDQDLERMEARLAAALEIDQTVRMLDFSRLPDSPRATSSSGIGSKRKNNYVEPRTRWKYGNWMYEGSHSRE